jgi:hypothetical protein
MSTGTWRGLRPWLNYPCTSSSDEHDEAVGEGGSELAARIIGFCFQFCHFPGITLARSPR